MYQYIVGMYIYLYMYFNKVSNILDITLKFNQRMYNINESDGLVQPMLILSDPLITSLSLQVITIDSSATSKW